MTIHLNVLDDEDDSISLCKSENRWKNVKNIYGYINTTNSILKVNCKNCLKKINK